jgi:hypothetical protein
VHSLIQLEASFEIVLLMLLFVVVSVELLLAELSLLVEVSATVGGKVELTASTGVGEVGGTIATGFTTGFGLIAEAVEEEEEEKGGVVGVEGKDAVGAEGVEGLESIDDVEDVITVALRHFNVSGSHVKPRKHLTVSISDDTVSVQ